MNSIPNSIHTVDPLKSVFGTSLRLVLGDSRTLIFSFENSRDKFFLESVHEIFPLDGSEILAKFASLSPIRSILCLTSHGAVRVASCWDIEAVMFDMSDFPESDGHILAINGTKVWSQTGF